MTKTRSLTIIIVVGFLVSILFSSMFSFAEEKLSFTAYYPSPNGYYNRLNSTFLSVSDTANVGKQLNIGLANPESNADVNIVSPNDSASLVLLGDNDTYSYATLALANPSDDGTSTNPTVWLMSHSAIPAEKHNLKYMYHGSEMDEGVFVTPLVMNPNGDIVFYGNVTIPNGRMSIGNDTITDHGLFVKRDFEDEDNVAGILASATQKPTTSGAYNIAGLKSEAIADLSSGDNTGSIKGIHSQALLKSSGTLQEAYGANIEVGLDADYGTIDKVYGVRIAVKDNSSTGGTINSAALVYLDPITLNVQGDLGYAIKQGGSTDINYFAGRVGIGTSDTTTHSLTVNGGAYMPRGHFEVCDDTKGVGNCSIINYNFDSGRVFLGNKDGSGTEPEVTVTGDLCIDQTGSNFVFGISNSISSLAEEINDCGECSEATCTCDEEATCETHEIVISGGCEFESDDTRVIKNRPDFTDRRKWLCSQEGSTALITRAYAICLNE